jgi:DNA uptake protein ComE-like DNA-binding protein
MTRSKHILLALALGMTIPVMAFAQESTTPSTAPATPPAATHSAKHASKPVKAHVNINTASKEELMALPGMSDATVDKIIAARPYKSRNQLVDMKVLTKAEYSKISGMITTGHQAKAPKK